MLKHWFWLFLTAAVVVWYSTITIYVGIKGVKDIKKMLGRLASIRDSNDVSDSPDQGK